MKTKKIYFISILTGLSLFVSSCSDDFLSEDPKTGKTETAYTTANGLTNLVTSCYAYTRGWYGKEAAISLTEGGTDIWLKGRDNRQLSLVEYSSITPASFVTNTSNNPCFDEYWEMLFAAVNTCNTALYYIEENKEITAAQKAQYKGEVSFLRAFYYWHLVETWGAVPIMKEMTNSFTTEVVRDSEEDVYDFMLADADAAIANLASLTTKTGRANLWAAKALKARLLLYLASEYAGGNYVGGQNQAYLDAAAVAQEVIAGSGATFYTNYSDCWNKANEDGKNNKEAIWSVEYNTNLTFNILPPHLITEMKDGKKTYKLWTQMIMRSSDNTTGGNCSHLMYTGLWSNHSLLNSGANKVLDRTDTEAKKTIQGYYVGSAYQTYSKGFCRYAPSGYLLDLIDETKDQRYAASFRDTYKIPAALTAYKNQSWFTQPDAKASDTIIYMSKHATLTAQETGMMAGKRYIMGTRTSGATSTFQFPMYANAQGSQLTKTTGSTGNFIFFGNNLFISCKKFDDWGTTSDGTAPLIRDLSPRDVFVFRLSEMYLIKAEAELGSGSGDPVATLNVLRAARAITAQDNSIASCDIQTILNERAIELCGEQQRWFDLKRLGKLTQAYLADKNLDASVNIQAHHRLRPIPQVQMDAVTNKATFLQNPGY